MEQLYFALIGLGLLIIASLGTLIKALTDRLVKDLATNTQITAQARDASNGRLSEVLAKLESERTVSAGLAAQLKAQQDHLAYVLAQHPELKQEFVDRRA